MGTNVSHAVERLVACVQVVIGVMLVNAIVVGGPLLLVTSPSQAADIPSADASWPNWRSVGQNGVAPPGDYPRHWSATENIAWKIALAGQGGSTPVVAGDRILMTGPIDDQNGVFCFDWNGNQLWQQRLGVERAGKHRKASGSNPSPVTDGKHVYVYFKSGDLAGFDLAGKALWHVNLQEKFGEDTLWWDLGTSPVLTDRYVVVACMQTGPSYLVAFDQATGRVAWKSDRMLDAPVEANQSYTTPLVTRYQGQQILVTLGADHVTAHAADDGRELWRVGGLNPEQDEYFRSIASPVIVDDIVIAPYARGETLTAIRLGGQGNVTNSHVLWTKQGLSADVPTPAGHDGKVYVCTDRGTLACLRATDGQVMWQTDLPKSRHAYSASPILAGELLYATREDGTTFVVRVASEPELVATNTLDDEFTVSSPVFSRNHILLRTAEHLYCIGNK